MGRSIYSLKGQWHEIFECWVFIELIASSDPLKGSQSRFYQSPSIINGKIHRNNCFKQNPRWYSPLTWQNYIQFRSAWYFYFYFWAYFGPLLVFAGQRSWLPHLELCRPSRIVGPFIRWIFFWWLWSVPFIKLKFYDGWQ